MSEPEAPEGHGGSSARGRRLQAQIPRRVIDVLRQSHPLKVLRGPRGYGKTSAIMRWLEERDDHVPVIRMTLTESSNLPDGFWDEVGRGLRAHDIEILERGDQRWSVMSTLAQQEDRHVLVIDDYHEAGLQAGSSEIDDDLVDVVRQNELLDLVVATRSYRTLETNGLLSVDGIVIGPDDLKMTGELVQLLAARLDVELTQDEAEAIAKDTGGWPSAIRAGLAHTGAGANGFDARLVDDYIVNMVRDPSSPETRSFMLRTAVPTRFTLETAREIAPSAEPLRILRELHAAGLVTELSEANETGYSYVPAVRRTLLRLGQEREPDTIRDVHRTLMERAISARDPARVLTHAIEAGELELAMSVVERDWSTLLATAPRALREAASRFPADMIERQPRLRIVLEDLESAPRGAVGPWTVDISTAIASEIHGLLASPDEDAVDELQALLHWAVTCVLSGNLDSAIYVFNRARTMALTGEAPPLAAELAGIGLALSHALDGEPLLALQWLDEPAVQQRLQRSGPAGSSDFAAVAAQVARVLALTDAVDPRVEPALTQLVEPAKRDDLWAATVFARGHHAAIGGDSAAVSRMAHDVRSAIRLVARGSLTEVGLAGTLVELLIAGDAADVAGVVAQRYDHSAIAWTTKAKSALAMRHYSEVLEYAGKALATPRRAWRTTLECHVLMASAHHATGDDDAARESFHHAGRLAIGTGQRRPFLLMPRYLFDDLVASEPELTQLWPPDSPAPQLTGVASPDLRSLTHREVQILRLLESHAGPVSIGRELGLSANTVKTHLRAIYRKLGVKNRAEALKVVGAQRSAE
ncbi:MAG: LuxR C-terminal-related transcriptional regulator [Beutenbergiaceae bacterium]